MPLFFSRHVSIASPGRARHDVIRGRFCFTSKAESPAARQLRSRVNEDLWSPEGPTTRPSPVETRVIGLFTEPKPPDGPCPSARRPYKSLCNADKYVVCCICLDSVEQRQQLKCPSCTMRAHSTCLGKWFDSNCPNTNGREPALDETKVVRISSAACPNCRGVLDWDTLVLHSRSKRMPLAQLLAKPINAAY